MITASTSDIFSKALALHNAGKLEEAEALYQSLLAANPNHVDALSLLGTIYSQRESYDEGIRLFDKVIALNPKYSEAYFNRALSLQMLGRYEEALKDYHQVTVIDPTYVEAFWHKSLILLTLGQYEEGWKLYEWRWKTRKPEEIRAFSQPMWKGNASATDKTILVHAEQGLGDTLQFCRYLPEVAKDNQVIFECDKSLVSLMQYNFANIKVIPFAKDSKDLPRFDYIIPLLSLPGVLGTTLHNMPTATYLKPEPQSVEKWAPIINEIKGTHLGIGVCWAGGIRPDRPDANKVDAKRSLHFEQIKPLLDTQNATFISLQMGPPKDQRNDDIVKDVSAEIKSWSDTAAIVSMLDLVISADTSVCHLAAGMGKHTFLLNRYDTCWRWLLNRDDSPWYPSLTQFRQQKPGDWTDVIERVKKAVQFL